MKKNLLQHQYYRISTLYKKLRVRLIRNFICKRFQRFSKAKQQFLLQRLEALRAKMIQLESRSSLVGATLLFSGALTSSVAFGQVGSEFQVNTYTTTDQLSASVALDDLGNYVVAWGSSGNPMISSFGQDGNYSGVYAQRYNEAGDLLGSEFRVNTYTTGNQSEPSIAMDGLGNFVVVWTSYGSSLFTTNGQDGSLGGVYAQRYNAAGAPVGSEFRVNTNTANVQSTPSVSMDGDGNFVITWTSYHEGNANVFAKLYDSDGVEQGTEFRVNTYTTSIQTNSSVAVDLDGDFVVCWQSMDQDLGGYGIYGQRYNSSGSPLGNEFQVNTYTTAFQLRPATAMDDNGNFIVTWMSQSQDTGSPGIYAKLYNADGTVQGSEFRVNTYTTATQDNPCVAMGGDGNFIISWNSQSQDGSDFGVVVKQFNSSGMTMGQEFVVNSNTLNDQKSPSIALNDDGDFLVTWQSELQDGDYYGVYAQRYKSIISGALEAEHTSRINLFPNPSSDVMHFELENTSDVKISDLSGKIVLEFENVENSISLKQLKPGFYMVEISQNDHKYYCKILVE